MMLPQKGDTQLCSGGNDGGGLAPAANPASSSSPVPSTSRGTGAAGTGAGPTPCSSFNALTFMIEQVGVGNHLFIDEKAKTSMAMAGLGVLEQKSEIILSKKSVGNSTKKHDHGYPGTEG